MPEVRWQPRSVLQELSSLRTTGITHVQSGFYPHLRYVNIQHRLLQLPQAIGKLLPHPDFYRENLSDSELQGGLSIYLTNKQTNKQPGKIQRKTKNGIPWMISCREVASGFLHWKTFFPSARIFPL